MASETRPDAWPVDGGEMGALIRARDWGATSLGPSATWSPYLRAALELILPAPFPAIILWGPELIQLYNDGYRTIMGGKHPAGLGRPTRDCWPEVWHLNAPIYARVRAGESLAFEDALYPIIRAGALEDAWFTLAYSPLRDESAAIAGVLVTVVETTGAVRARALEAERARLAAALVAGEGRLLAEIFRRSPAFLHVLRGPEFVFELANDAYYRLVGHRDLLGHPAFAALPEAGADGFQARLAAVVATGEPFVGREVPVTLARTPGAPPEERLIDLLYLPMPPAPSGEARVLGYGTDVTDQARERHRAEAALREGEARFRGFAEASADTLWIVEAATGRLAYLSPAFEAMFGAPRAALARDLATWGALVHPDDRGEATRTLPRALAGAVAVVEYRIVRPVDGATRWIRDTGFPIRDDPGAVAFVGGVAQDVTADKEASLERERLLAEAEAAVRARDTFLSIAAHELRNPLAALRGNAQLLRRRLERGQPDPDRLDAMIRAIDRLAGLTDDLLDVSRLQSGQLPLIAASLDLGALARAAVAERSEGADATRLALDADPALPPVLADGMRIAQVLDNLLGNALKYSMAGEAITVTLRTAGAGVRVAVQDTGIGLPPGSEEAIFTPFGRASNATASVLPGLGLGLFICRRIVERHGGWITAASAGEGQGTTVTFWLPTAGPQDVPST